MKNIILILIIFCLLTSSGCFSYKKILKNNLPDEINYEQMIDESIFSAKEREAIRLSIETHASNPKKVNELKFIFWLYKREYNISYLADTLNEQRAEAFAGDLYEWFTQKNKN